MAYTEKVAGYSSIVKVDPAGGTSYTALTDTTAITPPDKERNKIDGTTLDDSREIMSPGTEKCTEFTFSQVWRVKSTNHEIIDTLYSNKATAAWQVSYPQATVVTDSFSGWVSKVTAAVKAPNDYWSREITVTTTTGITRA